MQKTPSTNAEGACCAITSVDPHPTEVRALLCIAVPMEETHEPEGG